MSSSRKIAANRANARRGTGPRSTAGKARSRLNALKHGLSVPASLHPALQQEVLQFMRVLAGEAKNDPVVLARAEPVAEAAIDVLRVRRARVELLRGVDVRAGLANPEPPPPPPPNFRPIRRWLKRRLPGKSVDSVSQALDRLERSFEHLTAPQPSGERWKETENSMAWDDIITQLERLERYERRARSRRDRALKEFERMKAKALSI
jgi:hypothetical protein